MMKSVLKFSEPLYGELQVKIIDDAMAIATAASENDPDSNELRAAAIAQDSKKYSELLDAFLPAKVISRNSGHSGGSWSAVRWAVFQLLLGYSIECVHNGQVYSL